jgi:hypothetical protein
MSRIHHPNRGVAALTAYVVGVVVTATAGYEVGARQLGYVPPSTRVASLFGPPGPTEAEVRRYGRMTVKADYLGNCREYTVDNRTQQVVDKGIVRCEPERDAARAKPRGGAFDSFRDAFGGGK